MRASNNNYIKIISIGFIVMTLTSILLFWIRYRTENNLFKNCLPNEAKKITIQPSGLIPDEIENDPNITIHSAANVSLYVHSSGLLTPKTFSLGIFNYVCNISEKGRNSNVFWHYKDTSTNEWKALYYDKTKGLIVYSFTGSEEQPDNPVLRKQKILYAGPEGISEVPDKNLGRFNSLIAGTRAMESEWKKFLVFDSKLRCFFKIDFDNKTVVRGKPFSKEDAHELIQIGPLNKNQQIMKLSFDQPKEKEGNTEKTVKQPGGIAVGNGCPYFLILDKSGNIVLLDPETLEIKGKAGFLPMPETSYEGKERFTMKNLLAYQVLPVTLDGYRGICVAALNKDGIAAKMSVFDENGIEIQSSDTQCYNNITNKYVSTSFGIYNNIAGGPYAFIVKFWLENLHPPVLSLISYFMANSIEPEAGHRAIFILPSSFIGMMGRTEEGNPVARFLTAVLLISPSIILSLILALRIKKNAIVLGLTKNEITFWMVATIAFGLVGYITYRLVNPKNSLVTCLNCGKSRRSDFEKCHRCNSSWHVPELTPPSWRVFDY